MNTEITKEDVVRDFKKVVEELDQEGYSFDKFVRSKGKDDCKISFEFIKV